MYGLPVDFTGAFFVGRTLESITFSENAVILAFDGRVSVSVESSLRHQFAADNGQGTVQSLPLSESKLMQLLGRSVTKAEGDRDGTLTLLFDNEHVLYVFDDQAQYESYLINDGEHEIVV